MSYLKTQIATYTIQIIKEKFEQKIGETDFIVNINKTDFEGHYTIVLFTLTKKLQTPINDLGTLLGDELIKLYPLIFTSYNIKGGFLNICIADTFLIQFLNDNYSNKSFGKQAKHGEKVMVEYSSPNTNKPLHLGHLRNNFLGYSIAKIYEWNGYDVFTSCIVNDRGVHICKSMYAWQKWGNGQTPQSANKKGDHFVGDYYVKFSDELKKEISILKEQGIDEKDAEKQSVLMQEVHKMLLLWEQGDAETINLWNTMNAWVYEGFESTYKKIGSHFNKIYYESTTYLLGKKFVENGLAENCFFQKEDKSIWIDLEKSGLDQKLLLRKDGTSVYITQDLGLAEFKHQDFAHTKSIYVVGDEQNYHFQVLKIILEKLQKNYAKGIYHLSYGMVELPTGKMKSREGTVVDADDLIDSMETIAKQHTINLGKANLTDEQGLNDLSKMIGLAALKFYLLRVEPKKKMIFNPEESIDFHGFTGPFIQYTYARICSILEKTNTIETLHECPKKLNPLERDLLIESELFTNNLEQSLLENNPSVIALYAHQLAKKFNSFYAQHSILQAEQEDIKIMRIRIASLISNILSNCATILGFQLPNKM